MAEPQLEMRTCPYYMPFWLNRYHGFHDHGTTAERVFVELLEHHMPPDVITWKFINQSWLFRFEEFDILFRLDPTAETFFVLEVANTTHTIYSKVLHRLETVLTHLVEDNIQQTRRLIEISILLLQSIEGTIVFMESSYESNWRGFTAPAIRRMDARDGQTVISATFGMNLYQIHDTTSHILPTSIRKICENVPDQWKILHVESVLRQDLVEGFYHRQAQIKTLLSDQPTSLLASRHAPWTDGERDKQLSREYLIEEMLTPQITFHGTPRTNVASIVQYGFKLPGTTIADHVIASPRTGTIYDRGIYSSPESYYALSFAGPGQTKTATPTLPGVCLFVCATLMGRTARESKDGNVHNRQLPGFDSHMTINKFEYIVYDSRSILPCYVIHLDMVNSNALAAMTQVQLNPTGFRKAHEKNKLRARQARKEMFPAEIEQEKAAKHAAALKWFPYGYGTAKGTSFVIEEIGEVSDDEEVYGDYQLARMTAWDVFDRSNAGEDKGQEGGMKSPLPKRPQYVEKSPLDEYTAARNAYRKS